MDLATSTVPEPNGLKRRASRSPSGRQLSSPVRTDPLEDDTICRDCDPPALARSDYISWEDYFMALAHLSGMRSKDPSTQVGACIVNPENRIVGIGYNGFPSGISDDKLPWTREAPDPLDTKYMYVCHAEMNAILNRNTSDTKDCRLYCTLFPCNECTKLIIQSGIKEVIFRSDKYHDQPVFVASRRLLDCAGVKYRQLIPECKSITINFLGAAGLGA
mmetsp:Transcript_81811/g.128843  ORF Transcript_81811/g.128843 Transcript_81811/m.128843 type:complete len:218 (+) Transcript_81811:59-712(+)